VPTVLTLCAGLMKTVPVAAAQWKRWPAGLDEARRAGRGLLAAEDRRIERHGRL
jgi:hypothetical protein